MEIREPVVRVRCPTPEDEERCRAALERAGLAPERQLTWLAVRDADPDGVNDLLVAAGVAGRVVVREQVGKLLGFVLDHGPELGARAGSLRANVARTLSAGGLERRWVPRPDAELVAAARELHEHLMRSRGGFVSWGEFTRRFCRPGQEGAAEPPSPLSGSPGAAG
jgi:hypothetical protein